MNKLNKMVKNPKIAKKSLKILTLKFIDYIFENNFKTELNLQNLSQNLNIKKRRLYDLTNVLEGIGYLKKYKKNIMEINPDFLRQILILKTKQIIKLENRLIPKDKQENKNEVEQNEKNYEENDLNLKMQCSGSDEENVFKEANDQVFNNFN